jgi:hypothetical protein
MNNKNYFSDRTEAGRLIADKLFTNYRYEDTIVLALSSGGVLVGANFQDKGWAHFTGSGGGGGGSGSNNEAGGGGGGGGGIIVIHVAGNLNVSANAVIKARGGNGGSSPSTGGEGGGGGGGSIQVWVGGTLSLEDAFNVVQIDARAGTGSASSGGGNGGDGWPGRNWISAMNFPVLSGATYQPVLEINFEGTVEYSTTGTQVAITSGIDTSSTTASFSSAQFLPASASATVEVEGSRDNFQSDDSGYMSLSNISRLNNKRFLRYRISITNSSATTPTVVDSISATYDMGTVKEFQMKSTGCGLLMEDSKKGPPPMAQMAILGVLLLMPLSFAILLARRRKGLGSGIGDGLPSSR